MNVNGKGKKTSETTGQIKVLEAVPLTNGAGVVRHSLSEVCPCAAFANEA